MSRGTRVRPSRRFYIRVHEVSYVFGTPADSAETIIERQDDGDHHHSGASLCKSYTARRTKLLDPRVMIGRGG